MQTLEASVGSWLLPPLGVERLEAEELAGHGLRTRHYLLGLYSALAASGPCPRLPSAAGSVMSLAWAPDWGSKNSRSHVVPVPVLSPTSCLPPGHSLSCLPPGHSLRSPGSAAAIFHCEARVSAVPPSPPSWTAATCSFLGVGHILHRSPSYCPSHSSTGARFSGVAPLIPRQLFLVFSPA